MAADDFIELIRNAVDPLHEDAVAYTPEGVALAVRQAIKNRPDITLRECGGEPDGASSRGECWVFPMEAKS